ncbi:hypothetical protein EDD37DRAFT_272235 [Exophiala viscosa]|uniref:Uncharacterized protein n=1 Tax=Exophiala viscosa TaxID=2486360 RepID=A0AAN6IIC5_9EURO|nr:hypothetical protein EDD36DRAFT_35144 [Exophiala viscosa]KAI1627681.1 hypothetical protein EDD37DRAFT_272235 [Exophiala viscosa]
MSSGIPSPHPQLEVDEDPTIDPDLYRYIVSLNESPNCYSRFFSALLIPQSSHAEFFFDLKTFREQPVIINVLEPGTSEAYRDCTRTFIASRFAHPWCRVNSDFKSGWTRASWAGATKKVSKEDKREEERLHRLLVPIWIAFRRRMFPAKEVLDEWLAKANEQQKQKMAEREAREVDRTASRNPDVESGIPSTANYPELGFKMGGRDTSPPETSPPASPSAPSASEATTVARTIVGLAFGGYITRDKRVVKYLKKKYLK